MKQRNMWNNTIKMNAVSKFQTMDKLPGFFPENKIAKV
jgi:hypothetical protein